MSNLFCPDCTAVLDPESSNCGCGWSEKPQRSNKKPIPDTTSVCTWRYQAKRCPMPATSNMDGKWQCRVHSANRHNHNSSIIFFDELDTMLQGKATELHDHMVKLFRKATYWEKGDHKFEVLKLDQEILMVEKARSPQWVHWCQMKIASKVMSDLEKLSQAHIDFREFRKRNPLPEKQKTEDSNPTGEFIEKPPEINHEN